MAKINNIIDDSNNITMSINWKLAGVIEPNIATGIPSTIHMLNMLLPMILPNKISCSFFKDDTIVVTNSGKDVPSATIVREIILSDIPIVLAILVALSTTRLLPTIMPINPNKVKNMAVFVLNLDGSSSSSILFLDIDIM